MVDWTLIDFKDKRAIYVNLGQTLVFIRRCKISNYFFFLLFCRCSYFKGFNWLSFYLILNLLRVTNQPDRTGNKNLLDNKNITKVDIIFETIRNKTLNLTIILIIITFIINKFFCAFIAVCNGSNNNY